MWNYRIPVNAAMAISSHKYIPVVIFLYFWYDHCCQLFEKRKLVGVRESKSWIQLYSSHFPASFPSSHVFIWLIFEEPSWNANYNIF